MIALNWRLRQWVDSKTDSYVNYVRSKIRDGLQIPTAEQKQTDQQFMHRTM